MKAYHKVGKAMQCIDKGYKWVMVGTDDAVQNLLLDSSLVLDGDDNQRSLESICLSSQMYLLW